MALEGRRWGPAVVIPKILAGAVIAMFTSRSIRAARPLTAGSAILINAYRADRPSFWQRTRDDWAVEAVMLGYWINIT